MDFSSSIIAESVWNELFFLRFLLHPLCITILFLHPSVWLSSYVRAVVVKLHRAFFPNVFLCFFVQIFPPQSFLFPLFLHRLSIWENSKDTGNVSFPSPDNRGPLLLRLFLSLCSVPLKFPLSFKLFTPTPLYCTIIVSACTPCYVRYACLLRMCICSCSSWSMSSYLWAGQWVVIYELWMPVSPNFHFHTF